MITPDLYDELMLFLMCEELSEKTSWLDVHALGINNTLQKCHLYCVVNCHENDYISKIRKEGTLPKYKNVSYISTNKKESFSQLSPIVSNDKPGHVEKLPLQPLPPKVKKKKKKRRRKRIKKKEEWVTTWPENIPRINFYPNGQKFMEDGKLDCIHYYLEDKSVGTVKMILIMICMLLIVIGKMVIMLLMILKIFLVPTLKMMIWKALSLGMIGLQVLYPLVM